MRLAETLLPAADLVLLEDELATMFDMSVDQDVAEELRTGNCKAVFPGLEFCAYCWYADDRFYGTVLVRKYVVGTYAADTPEELAGEIAADYAAAKEKVRLDS